LDDWKLLPPPERDRELRAHWTPGAAAGRRRLASFVRSGLDAYDRGRDRPAADGTARLSPYLHFGEISPRQAWAAVTRPARREGLQAGSRGAAVFLSELGWREFAQHLLWFYPDTPTSPLRAAYRDFPWQINAAARDAWRRGETGLPLVDAGMRQLRQTGWMHNRVRMVVASVLVKQLLQPWTEGAAWFWDALVDADLAANTLNWQWSAGCGADAAPYFRVFNPVRQGERFDPAGVYVRRWVPELSRVPEKWIHQPWRAPADVLAASGVVIGRDYPRPLVEPEAGRRRALAAFQQWRKQQALAGI
jgi:deoxyribodipyrimidine photo-lyase